MARPRPSWGSSPPGRPAREEAVEDPLAVLGGNPGARVVDVDDDRRAFLPGGDRDGRAGRREADGVREEVLEGLDEPLRRGEDGERAGRRVEAHGHAVCARRRAGRDELPQERSEIDGDERLGLEPRVDARDLAHAAEEAVEPRDLALDRGEELAALGGIVGFGEHLRGASDGGERVAELVGDVGREGLDEGQVPLGAGRQLLEGPGEVADLVPPPRAAEGAAQPAARVEEAAGFVAETDERPGDGGRDEKAEGRGGEDREDEDAKDVEADRPERREDAGRGARDDDRAADVAPAVRTGMTL